MHLVNNDVRHAPPLCPAASKTGITLQHPEEDAGGAEEKTRRTLGALRLEANAVPHFSANAHVSLRRNALCEAHRGQPPRLSANHRNLVAAARVEPLVEDVLRHLRRLPAARAA